MTINRIFCRLEFLDPNWTIVETKPLSFFVFVSFSIKMSLPGLPPLPKSLSAIEFNRNRNLRQTQPINKFPANSILDEQFAFLKKEMVSLLLLRQPIWIFLSHSLFHHGSISNAFVIERKDSRFIERVINLFSIERIKKSCNEFKPSKKHVRT